MSSQGELSEISCHARGLKSFCVIIKVALKLKHDLLSASDTQITYKLKLKLKLKCRMERGSLQFLGSLQRLQNGEASTHFSTVIRVCDLVHEYLIRYFVSHLFIYLFCYVSNLPALSFFCFCCCQLDNGGRLCAKKVGWRIC